jgi:hypothetical protein
MEQSKVQLGVLLTLSAAVLLIASTSGQEHSQKKAGGEKPAARADPAVVARLIAQLGTDDFKTREKASQQLAELDEVPDALRRATKDSDAEVARRARAAVTTITKRVEERAFQAMLRDLHRVELDRLIRRMVTDKRSAGDKEWKIIQAITRAVTAEANKCAGRRIPVPDFAGDSIQRLLLTAASRRPAAVSHSTVLSAGATPYITSITNCLVLVDGDFTGATGINNCLLIVRGNVGRVTVVSNSIILATGNWEGATRCDNSFVQVNNHLIRFTGARDSVLINTLVQTTGPTDSRVLTTHKGPLQLVKFSPRPSDTRVVWSKEVNNLAVALVGIDTNGQLLIRWKNVGKEVLQLPWVRFTARPIDNDRDDLLDHVVLIGPDGKRVPTRKHPAPRRRPRVFDRCVVLGPGRTHEETINLWTYVEKPEARGKYQLSIELDIPLGRRGLESKVKMWSGKIQSKTLEVPLGK